MASLALMAGLIFLTVILVGPTVYLLSWIKIIPSIIIYFLAAISILIGIWWATLPLGIIQFIALLPIVFGVISINNRVYKGK